MYLSRIKLNAQKRNTQIALASRNRIHGAVERCFSEKEERKLWRIDQLNNAHYLLILSHSRPDLQQIKEQYGYPAQADEIKRYDNFLQNITENSVWQFRLTANPVHTIKQDGKNRGKVVAHVSEKYQMEWLEKKANQNGFEILTEGSCVIGSDWRIFGKNGQKERVRLKEAVYQGVLRVQNADLFRKALTEGIGRGKAYGMGMLTIVRVRE